MSENSLDDRLDIRISSVDKATLLNKAANIGRPWQQLLREFVTAFNEDRLRITVTDNQLKNMKGMYYVTRK